MQRDSLQNTLGQMLAWIGLWVSKACLSFLECLLLLELLCEHLRRPQCT